MGGLATDVSGRRSNDVVDAIKGLRTDPGLAFGVSGELAEARSLSPRCTNELADDGRDGCTMTTTGFAPVPLMMEDAAPPPSATSLRRPASASASCCCAFFCACAMKMCAFVRWTGNGLLVALLSFDQWCSIGPLRSDAHPFGGCTNPRSPIILGTGFMAASAGLWSGRLHKVRMYTAPRSNEKTHTQNMKNDHFGVCELDAADSMRFLAARLLPHV